MAFIKATKSQSKLRLALCGLAGSGKTYSALAIAAGIAAEMRRLGHGQGRIALIDTEHESASLYADRFDFDTAPLDNHSPRAYVDMIREAEAGGYDVVIVDSLSHAWAGKNGALEQKDNAAARGGNSWTAWRDITPMHNALVDAMLASKCHLIATMRQKMEYIQTTEGGKTKIEKVGLAAIQREGMEYEFTCVGDLGLDHVLRIGKTRLDGVLSTGEAFERPGELFAKKVYGWLMSGAAPVKVETVVDPNGKFRMTATSAVVDSLHKIGLAGSLEELDSLIPTLKTLTGEALIEGRRRYNERKAWLMKMAAGMAQRIAEAQREEALSANLGNTGTNCSECEQPQFSTPSGVTCPNGHGGADAMPTAPEAA